MQQLINEFRAQLEIFNIIFDETSHTYLVDGKLCTNVTALIKQYKKPFDSEYHSLKKAISLGVSQSKILEEWRLNNLRASLKGSALHSYIESKLSNKVFKYPYEEITKNWLNHDPIYESFNQCKLLADKFLDDNVDKLVPIVSELRLGCSKMRVAGTIDQLMWSETTQSIWLIDWKTNKKIDKHSKYYHLSILSHIPDCELDYYSLQLNLYKSILERKTTIKIDKLVIVWFNEANDDYCLFECKDYQKEAQQILAANSQIMADPNLLLF